MAVVIVNNDLSVLKMDEKVALPRPRADGGRTMEEFIIVRSHIAVDVGAAEGSISQNGNQYNMTDKGVIRAVLFQLAAFGKLAASELICDCTIDLRVNDWNIAQAQKYVAIPAVGGAFFPRFNHVMWMPNIDLPLNDDDYFKSILHADNSASTGDIGFAGQCWVYIQKED